MTYGSDIEALKRAVSRAGFWNWTDFDRNYTEAFAMGSKDMGPGIRGLQRKRGLRVDGAYGATTHRELKKMRVPVRDWKGDRKENAGQPVWDDYAAQVYRAYLPEMNEQDIRRFLVEFANIGLANPEQWHYRLYRPVVVEIDPANPKGTTDCSGSVIQAYNYAKRKSGLLVPDPAKQSWTGYGNTSYHEDDHPKTYGPYQVGDLAHYEGHVCYCIKRGSKYEADWWSFGSEPPSKRKLNYRSDFRFVCRPPLT
jgi:hypothetical protein